MAKIPKNAKRIENRPLALGEVTGHHHSLVADPELVEMYEKDGQIFVHANAEIPLQHQEHKPHVVPADSDWGIRIATEVTDWGRKQVQD
jgi:hypothetical protein